jgi:hypothetical protein
MRLVYLLIKLEILLSTEYSVTNDTLAEKGDIHEAAIQVIFGG